MKRAGPVALAVVLALGVAWALSQASEPTAAATEDRPPETVLVGGFGSLGSGSSGPSVGLAPEARHDAGRAGYDGGVPAVAASGPPIDPADMPAMIVLPSATPNDAYDTANLVWGVLAVRRVQVREDLEAARAAGDADAIRLLERTLGLIDSESARLEQRMRTLQPPGATPTAPADPAHAEGAEGAAP